VPPSPAAVVTIAHRLELAAAYPEVERAARRMRAADRGWTAIAMLLGPDALPCHVDDPAQLSVDTPEACRDRRAALPGKSADLRTRP
jgi:hypothetical protein